MTQYQLFQNDANPFCQIFIYNVLMKKEMYVSYNKFLFHSFLSALHISNESSRSSSGARHNTLYYPVQSVESCRWVYRLACTIVRGWKFEACGFVNGFTLSGVAVKILLFGFFFRVVYVAHNILHDLFNKRTFNFSATSNSRSSC